LGVAKAVLVGFSIAPPPLTGPGARDTEESHSLRHFVAAAQAEGDELVEQPFGRLIAEHKLLAFRWDGFWQCMDTFKDKITLDRKEARGDCPWMRCQRHPAKAPQ
jgi:hypothetical protein